ncbi:MAG: alpha-galactosidase [Clostridia bacterium]|nr:alpha-galactosidase [Clostridia bacterium]
MKQLSAVKKLGLPVIILSVLVLTLIGGNQAFAANGLTLSTSYPGLTVKPGETIRFTLEIENSGLPSQSIKLATRSIPEGWNSEFQGGGREVHQVFVKRGDYETVNYQVEVPAETEEGTYQIQVAAQGGSVADILTLELQVSREAQLASKLLAQYPELQGPSSAVFTFKTDLVNNSSQEQSYSLGAATPAGWGVVFKPSYENKQIASLSVEPGKSQGLQIEITPPSNVKAGEYKIPIRAISAEETIETELTVIITGNYELKLSTPTGLLSFAATAGQEKAVALEVVNTGSADLKDIKLSSWAPTNWTVTFEPDHIAVLPAGESQEVKAYVQPDNKALAGDYVVQMTARAPEATGQAEFRVSVKTSTIWGIVGLVIILLLAVGLYRTFKVYGRR